MNNGNGAGSGTQEANVTQESLGVDLHDLAALYRRCAEAAEPSEPAAGTSAGAADEKNAVAAMRAAREDSAELGGRAPDAVGTAILSLLASMSGKSSAVYVGSAPGVVALALLAGLSPAGNSGKPGAVTAITSDPHLADAGKKAVAAAGYPGSACRIIAARPLEVMGKLAADSYGLVVADAGEVEAAALAERALELVGGGAVVVLGAEDYFDALTSLPEGARVTHLPAARGISVLTAR